MEASSGFSSDLLVPVVVMAGFIAIFALLIWVVVHQQKRATENLEKLAATLGLAVFRPPQRWFGGGRLELNGTFRGRAVRIYGYTTGSGKSQVHWCALAVAVQNPGRFTLRISRENLFTRAGRVFGVEDVATGDKAFDEQFYVKSSDSGYVRAALIPEVRAEILQLWKAGARGSITTEPTEVRYAEQGGFANVKICDRFPGLLKVTCDVAEIVEARRG